MLVKVGGYRINLAHVARIDDAPSKVEVDVFFIDGEAITLAGDQAEILCAAWDKWAQFQSDAQTINEFAVAENLKQINQAQNKSGIIQPVPKMPLVNRGRG
jgi:hypothetical protein